MEAALECSFNRVHLIGEGQDRFVLWKMNTYEKEKPQNFY